MRTILCLYGPSGAGKTTWLVEVVARLRERGVRVATVKTCHHDAAIEPERKDSARHLVAGAEEVLLLAPGKSARLFRRAGAKEEDEILRFARETDAEVVLVEGAREAPFAKVAVLASPAKWNIPVPFPCLARVGRPPVENAPDWTDPVRAAEGIVALRDLRLSARGVLGIALAGGRGRRLGGLEKSRLVVGGLSLAERARRLLRVHFERVALAAPAGRDLTDLGLPVVGDAPGVAGPLGGLLAALRASREGVFVLGVDHIGVTPATIGRILEAGLSTGGAVLADGGRIVPTIGYLSRRRLAEVEALAARGERALGRAFEGAARVSARPGEAIDLDRPEDLARVSTA